MRVVINGLASLKPKTGVGHHVAQLTRALIDEFPEDHFWLYPGESLARLGRRMSRYRSGGAAPGESRSALHRIAGLVGTLAKRSAKAGLRFHFSRTAGHSRFDLYHEPNFVPLPTCLPTVITIHDLSVLRYPDWHPADRVRLHQNQFLEGICRASHIITVSDAVREEVISKLSVPPDRITTVQNGLNSFIGPVEGEPVRLALARLGLRSGYFLAVGTIEPRKNIGTIMRAYTDLPAAIRSKHSLVLVGPWGWKSEPDREFYESTGRASGVIHLGYVSDADLPALYCGAAALLYPSFYEGFGLPPLEMLSCGGRVVASAIPAVREVCGSLCTYVEPADFEGWRTALHRLATTPDDELDNRSERTRHAAGYTWAKAARETLAVYRRVLGLHAGLSPSTARTSPRSAA